MLQDRDLPCVANAYQVTLVKSRTIVPRRLIVRAACNISHMTIKRKFVRGPCLTKDREAVAVAQATLRATLRATLHGITNPPCMS